MARSASTQMQRLQLMIVCLLLLVIVLLLFVVLFLTTKKSTIARSRSSEPAVIATANPHGPGDHEPAGPTTITITRNEFTQNPALPLKPQLPEIEAKHALPEQPVKSTASDAMDLFFKNMKMTPATPDLKSLIGNWKAEVKSLAAADALGAMDVSVLAPFNFSIQQEGQEFVLVPAAGARRKLSATDSGIVGRADGVPELQLSLNGDILRGQTDIDKPLNGRLEFHATRVP